MESETVIINKRSVKKGLGRKARENIVGLLFFTPALLPLVVFSLYPIIKVFWLSFYDYDGYSPVKWVGLENYIMIFTKDTGYWISVINTVCFTLVKLAIEIPLAVISAVVLYNTKVMSGFFKSVYFIPQTTSMAILGPIFIFLFTPYQGLINELLIKIGLIQQAYPFFSTKFNSFLVVIIADVWYNFGYNMLFYVAGLSAIDREIYESAEVDGVGRAQKFFYITLPLLKKITTIVILLAMVGTMRHFDTVYVITGGGPYGQTDVIMTYIYKKFFAAAGMTTSIGYGSSFAVVTSAILAFVSGIYLYLNRKVNEN